MITVILWGTMILAGATGFLFGNEQMRGSILLIAVGVAFFAAVNAIQNGFRKRLPRVYWCDGDDTRCSFIGGPHAAEKHHLRTGHTPRRVQ